MIGYLRGTVLQAPVMALNEPLLLDVNGVGYEIQVASIESFVIGSERELHIFTVVRPDALLLYGFVSREDRKIFEALLATPGVGPSTALAALRTFSSGDLLDAIQSGDVKRVGLIPGVGAKTAARIVLELKGKLVLPEAVPTPSPVTSDIEEALKSWGYATTEIRDALRDVPLPTDEAQALKLALNLLRRP